MKQLWLALFLIIETVLTPHIRAIADSPNFSNEEICFENSRVDISRLPVFSTSALYPAIFAAHKTADFSLFDRDSFLEIFEELIAIDYS